MGKIEEGNNKLEANGGFFAVRVFKKRSEDELKPDLRLDNIRVGIHSRTFQRLWEELRRDRKRLHRIFRAFV